jgi:hypothetical protein
MLNAAQNSCLSRRESATRVTVQPCQWQ